MTSRSVRGAVIGIAAVALCSLAVAGGVPAATADVNPSPAAFSTGDAGRAAEEDLFPLELPDLSAPEVEDTMTLSVQGEVGGTRQVTLSCGPARGSHPEPDKACAQLSAANGDISEIPPEAGVCTAEYAPVTVVADGTWAGWGRSYTRTFGNRCQAIRTTGGVLFDF